MTKVIKTIAFLFPLWILAQAVAWFYGGKDAAGFVAVLSLLPLLFIGLALINYGD